MQPPCKKHKLDIASCVAQLVSENIEGDPFTGLKQEIEGHLGADPYVNLKFPSTSEHHHAHRILYVCEKSVILEEVELTVQEVQITQNGHPYDAGTRFVTRRVLLEDWSDHFHSWLDRRSGYAVWLVNAWFDGMNMYK